MQFLTRDFLVLSLELNSPILEGDVVLEFLNQSLYQIESFLSRIQLNSLQYFLVFKVSCKVFGKACFLTELYWQVNSIAVSPIDKK